MTGLAGEPQPIIAAGRRPFGTLRRARTELFAPVARSTAMADMLKHLSAGLRRYFEAIVRTPMPWRMIDKLESLQEACEQREQGVPQSGSGGAGGDRTTHHATQSKTDTQGKTHLRPD
jgi:hypothetical protein